MPINLYFEGVKRPYFSSKQGVLTWLKDLALVHGYSIQELNVIFVSDEQLLLMNRQFLDHDYYTDIITFDTGTKEGKIMGELYISLDRVRENARNFNEKFQLEYIRVIAHGLLHLIGFQDKTAKQISQIRLKENEAIELYLKKNQNTQAEINGDN
jgi:rRNA maturation RNase YbeY